MAIKKTIIRKGNTGLYHGEYIDEDGDKHVISTAFGCFTKIGCKRAIKKYLHSRKDLDEDDDD